MKKLFVTCNDGSKTVYTIKNNVDHMQYVRRHINHSYVKSISVQASTRDIVESTKNNTGR